MNAVKPGSQTKPGGQSDKMGRVVFPFLQSVMEFVISPTRTDLFVPPGISPGYVQARERILTVMIRIGAVLGFVTLLQSVPAYWAASRVDLILAYTVPLILLWAVALHRRLEYRWRTGLFLLLLYGLSLLEMLIYGDSIESHEYLFVFTIITTIFLGGWAGNWAMVLSMVTLGGFNWCLGTGRYTPPEVAYLYYRLLPLEELIGTWLVFCMILGAVNVGLIILMNNLNRAWQREHELVGLLKQERDHLEQRVVERTHDLAEARDQAMSANQYKGELMAKVSHDLRTPLAAILGYTELFHSGLLGPITDDQKSSMAKVLQSTYHLTEMVNDLLDQAQIERGQIQIQVVSFSPGTLVEELSATLTVLANAKGLTLTIEATPELPAVLLGDPKRLKQILTNLINNALKFTETGGVTVRLEGAGSDRWAMKVTDTGPGIPEDVQARIYESFWQLDNSVTRKQKGYGLGLSIVKQLVELMGGEIFLESKPGQGSTFTVVLPLIVKTDDQTTRPTYG